MDVILPKPLSYNDFGVPIGSQYKFAKKVSKLNLNIIFLCLKYGVSPEEIHPTQSLYNLHLLFTSIKCNNNNQTNIQAERTTVTEKLYDLSVLSAATLDRLSPTSEDLTNDSDDDGRDENKALKVQQHMYNYYTCTLYRLYITAHSPNNSITLHCMDVISRKYNWPFGLVFSSFINTRLRQQLVNNKNHLNGHNFFAGQAESGHLDLGSSSLRLLLPRPPGGDDTWLRGNLF